MGSMEPSDMELRQELRRALATSGTRADPESLAAAVSRSQPSWKVTSDRVRAVESLDASHSRQSVGVAVPTRSPRVPSHPRANAVMPLANSFVSGKEQPLMEQISRLSLTPTPTTASIIEATMAAFPKTGSPAPKEAAVLPQTPAAPRAAAVGAGSRDRAEILAEQLGISAALLHDFYLPEPPVFETVRRARRAFPHLTSSQVLQLLTEYPLSGWSGLDARTVSLALTDSYRYNEKAAWNEAHVAPPTAASAEGVLVAVPQRPPPRQPAVAPPAAASSSAASPAAASLAAASPAAASPAALPVTPAAGMPAAQALQTPHPSQLPMPTFALPLGGQYVWRTGITFDPAEPATENEVATLRAVKRVTLTFSESNQTVTNVLTSLYRYPPLIDVVAALHAAAPTLTLTSIVQLIRSMPKAGWGLVAERDIKSAIEVAKTPSKRRNPFALPPLTGANAMAGLTSSVIAACQAGGVDPLSVASIMGSEPLYAVVGRVLSVVPSLPADQIGPLLRAIPSGGWHTLPTVTVLEAMAAYGQPAAAAAASTGPQAIAEEGVAVPMPRAPAQASPARVEPSSKRAVQEGVFQALLPQKSNASPSKSNSKSAAVAQVNVGGKQLLVIGKPNCGMALHLDRVQVEQLNAMTCRVVAVVERYQHGLQGGGFLPIVPRADGLRQLLFVPKQRLLRCVVIDTANADELSNKWVGSGKPLVYVDYGKLRWEQSRFYPVGQLASALDAPQETLYPEHLPIEEARRLVAEGKLAVGKLRIAGKGKITSAYVSSPDYSTDISMTGERYRNRAFDGDLVAVKMTSEDRWKTVTSRFGSKQTASPSASSAAIAAKRDEAADAESDMELSDASTAAISASPSTAAISASPSTAAISASPSAAAVAASPSRPLSSASGKDSRRPVGQVVCILEPSGNRLMTGVLTQVDNVDEAFVVLKPRDQRMPVALLKRSELPEEALAGGVKEWATRLLAVEVAEWPATSPMPIAHFKSVLGTLDSIQTHTAAILAEQKVSDWDEFSEPVKACLPALPWAISDEERATRRDLSDRHILTIDPSTARDLDDSLHWHQLDDDTYEIGVHIADVSHFVLEGSALDAEAKRRSTTIYLTDRALHMLPRPLCETLCSLNPRVERLAFSVIFKMTNDGEVLEKWFGRTIINSAGRLSYDDAQEIIEASKKYAAVEDKEALYSAIENDVVDALPTGDDVAASADDDADAKEAKERARRAQNRLTIESVLRLHGIAQELRQRRRDRGVLSLNRPRLHVLLDENKMPLECINYVLRESNRLVESFMLLANEAVAQRIYESFPEFSLLRRHPPPRSMMLEDTVAYIRQLGYEIDATSAGSIQRSIDAITDPVPNMIVQRLLCTAMLPAEYFCSGDIAREDFAHYALATDMYTHFTSPIRRYPDIIVHRLLDLALRKERGEDISAKISPSVQTSMSATASHCNVMKTTAKQLSDRSALIYLGALIDRMGAMTVDAVVLELRDNGVRISVIDFALEELAPFRVAFEGFSYDEDNSDPKNSQLARVEHGLDDETGRSCCILRFPAKPEEGLGARSVKLFVTAKCRVQLTCAFKEIPLKITLKLIDTVDIVGQGDA